MQGTYDQMSKAFAWPWTFGLSLSAFLANKLCSEMMLYEVAAWNLSGLAA